MGKTVFKLSLLVFLCFLILPASADASVHFDSLLALAEPLPPDHKDMVSKPTEESGEFPKVSESPAPIVKEEEKEEEKVEEEVKAPPPPPPPPAAQPAGDVWYRVRVGIFSKKSSAVVMLGKLRAEGYSPFLVQQAGLWRVQVGAFREKPRADAVAEKLRARGYATDVISSK